jgi:hypothetical protein
VNAPTDPIVTIVRPETRTPADELADFERAIGATVPDDVRDRFFEAQVYRGGDLAALHDAGRITMRPQGKRVLLRAILQEDASVMTLSGEIKGEHREYDARTCIAHVIEDIGPGVAKFLREQGYDEEQLPKVGDHCFVLSTVADRASKTSRAVRLWTVDVQDLSLVWRP